MATPEGGTFSWEDVQRQIQQAVDAAIQSEREAHAKEVADLRISLSGIVASPVPEHAGGPGTEIAGTWSQWEQELSRAEAEAARRK